MIEKIKKFITSAQTLYGQMKQVVIAVFSLVILLFIYRKGKSEQQNEQLKGNFDAIKKAKKIRTSITDSDIRKLHTKYKR